jgi:UDPglucose 6-dehydrogenase
MDGYKLIVNKSTVPVYTGQKVKHVIQEVLDERGFDYEFDIVSNPEFLREGAAVQDFLHPDRIIIGTESVRAREMMRNVYRVLYLYNHPFVFTNIETAELIKYASNSFLATKITFINEIANLCEVVGANVQEVAKGMGLDGRIGKYFLHSGPGYGGSCFPKDTKALVNTGEQLGVKMTLVDAVIKANECQKLRMVSKILAALGEVKDKTIAVLGLAFKPETDDIREAPSICIVSELVRNGAAIRVYDPVAMNNAARDAFKNIALYYACDEYDAVEGADALVIVTEWNQFRSINLSMIKEKMCGRFFFDLRNIYDRKSMEEAGFAYFAVGR